MKIFSSLLLIANLALLLVCSQNIVAQGLPLDKKTGKITFAEVVYFGDSSSISKDILYKNAKEWFVKTFKSSSKVKVIQQNNKELGKIAGKGSFALDRTAFLTDSRVDFAILLMVKDGQYKYEMSDFMHVAYHKGYSGGRLEDEKPDCGNFNLTKKGWKQVKEQTKLKIDLIIADLKNSMENP